jgi:hypothetical protein
MKIKVMEAMAGTPSSRRRRRRGMDVVSGESALVAEDDRTIADHVCARQTARRGCGSAAPRGRCSKDATRRRRSWRG